MNYISLTKMRGAHTEEQRVITMVLNLVTELSNENKIF